MSRVRVLPVFTCVASLLLLAGCGGAVKKKATEEKPPAKADKAIEKVAKKLDANRPDYAWAALPPSYRKDVDGLVKEFAKSTDKEIYNTNLGMLQKVVKILETKKKLILENDQLKNAEIDTQELSKNWDAVVKLVSIPVNSELSDVEKLKKLDIENFLATTGSKFMKQMKVVSKLAPEQATTKGGAKKKMDLSAMLKGCKAKVVKSEGDTATVRVEAPDVEASEEEFVKVEGHWIPKELADNWKQYMSDAKAKLKDLAGSKEPKNKKQYLATSKQIDGVLDMMLAAETKEDFSQAIGQGMGMLMGMMMRGMGGEGGMPGMQGMPKMKMEMK